MSGNRKDDHRRTVTVPQVGPVLEKLLDVIPFEGHGVQDEDVKLRQKFGEALEDIRGEAQAVGHVEHFQLFTTDAINAAVRRTHNHD